MEDAGMDSSPIPLTQARWRLPGDSGFSLGDGMPGQVISGASIIFQISAIRISISDVGRVGFD